MIEFLLTISDKSDPICIQTLYLVPNDGMGQG